MDAKEKAWQLFNRMYKYQLAKNDPVSWELAKKQSDICVDELLIQANLMDGGFSFEKEIVFLQEVKQEIYKL